MLRTLTILTFSLLIFPSLLWAKDIGLKTGSTAPQIMTKDIDGNIFNLEESTKSGPVILVFYRGGWCPYCNTQLRSLQANVVPELKKHNAQLVAISVDKVDEVIKTKNTQKIDMTLISDPDAVLLKAYNLVNKVEDSLVKKYKEDYKIDVEAASGKKHHIIAIPAVFVVKKNRKVKFAYANEEYKVRAQEKGILDALKK